MKRKYNSDIADRMFDALTSSDRREVLRLLMNENTEIEAEEIAERLEESGESRKRQVSLEQTDLPKLQDVGWIEKGEEGYAVSTAIELSSVPEYMDLLDEEYAGEVFQAIRDEDRRLITNYMLNESRPVSVERLQEVVFENQLEENERDGDNVRIQMYHVHIPHLDKCDIIDFDEKNYVATPGDLMYDAEDELKALFGNLYGSK